MPFGLIIMCIVHYLHFPLCWWCKVTEDLVALLIPYIVRGIARDSSADFQAATQMTVAQLTSRAALGEKLLSGNGHVGSPFGLPF